jgi:hypothetical protein
MKMNNALSINLLRQQARWQESTPHRLLVARPMPVFLRGYRKRFFALPKSVFLCWIHLSHHVNLSMEIASVHNKSATVVITDAILVHLLVHRHYSMHSISFCKLRDSSSYLIFSVPNRNIEISLDVN